MSCNVRRKGWGVFERSKKIKSEWIVLSVDNNDNVTKFAFSIIKKMDFCTRFARTVVHFSAVFVVSTA